MKYLSLIIVIFSCNLSFGQDTLTFKHYLKIGLERNFSVQIVRNNETIATNNVGLGNAGMLPTLTATGRFTKNMIGLSRAERQDTIIERTNFESQNVNAGVTLNWDIFDGFQMFVQYNKLNELQKLGELNTRMAIENLISEIGSECFNYVQQKKRLQTLSYVMKLSKERLNVARERYLIGNISKLEFQEAAVDFNSDSSNYMRQELSVATSRVNLNRILAINPMVPTEVIDSIIIDETLLYNNLNEDALLKNTSLLIAQKNQSLSDIELRLINSRVYPVLSIFGGYTYSNQKDPTNPSNIKSLTHGLNYGAGLTFNIFDGFNLHRQRSNAKIAIKNSELRYKEVEQDIISNLSLIYNQYQNALKSVSLETSNLRTALDNFQIATERYRLGSLSGLQMREIERVYLDAEDRLLSAQYQAKLAEISLKLISGRITEYL